METPSNLGLPHPSHLSLKTITVFHFITVRLHSAEKNCYGPKSGPSTNFSTEMAINTVLVSVSAPHIFNIEASFRYPNQLIIRTFIYLVLAQTNIKMDQ